MAVPIVFRALNPRVQTLAGNAYFTVSQLTNWDPGHVEFVSGADGKFYYQGYIPDNLAPGTPTISYKCACNATSGAVVLGLAFLRVPSGGSYNGAFTVLTNQTITVPAAAYQRFDVTFSTGLTIPAVGDEYFIEVFRNGANTGVDTVAVPLHLYDVVMLT